MPEEKLKKVFWYLLNGFLVIAIVFGILGAGFLWRANNAVVPSRTITVSGEGKISIKPDIASVSFAVVSQGENPKTISEENTQKINKALEYIRSQGVEEKDIKTSDYNLYPRYRWSELRGESLIVGYELRQTINIKLRDLERVGEIIGGLAGVGINEIHSLSFSVEDPEVQRNEARVAAFEQARVKAEAMAKASGVSIARVVNFSETSQGYPGPYYDRSLALGKGGDGESFSPDIQPGEQEIAVQISVTYEIR